MPVSKDHVPIVRKEPVLTQGAKKVLLSFNELALSEIFMNKVRDIQSRYGLPLIDETDEGQLILGDYLKWIDSLGQARFEKLKKEFYKLTDDYGYYTNFENPDPFIDLLVYNEESGSDLRDCGWDVVMVEDRNSTEASKSITNRRHKQAFPVALYISPYATANDIWDFLEKKFKTKIKPTLEQYKKGSSKIGLVKEKSLEKSLRNNKIYQFRSRNREEQRKLFGKDFDMPDAGAFSKILSLERKRRK